jgi:hypothetical protein
MTFTHRAEAPLSSASNGLRQPTFSRRFYSTYDDYLRHPVFRAVRSVAMRQAGGLCGCGAPATEVHHVRYPPWGTFDVPSNLQPVCHGCHCRLEGMPS